MSSGTSYNGWPANSDKSAIGVVSSDYFPGGAKSGDVTTVLGYVARQLDARVEPFVAGWGWGYTYKTNANNPSQLSCHASGTAIDWNAPDHPNGSGGTFSSAQRGEIYAILDEVQGAVSWLEGYDEMHFEICVSASTLAKIAATLPASGGGKPNPPEPEPEPEPEDDDMPLKVMRDKATGIDYAHSPHVFIRINDEAFYNNLLYLGWIDTPHGQGQASERNIIDWCHDRVATNGGTPDPV